MRPRPGGHPSKCGMIEALLPRDAGAPLGTEVSRFSHLTVACVALHLNPVALYSLHSFGKAPAKQCQFGGC
jgi:hypothetical protein